MNDIILRFAYLLIVIRTGIGKGGGSGGGEIRFAAPLATAVFTQDHTTPGVDPPACGSTGIGT